MKLETKRYLGQSFDKVMQRLIAITALMLSFSAPAFANGQRELDDGIAFYENLDTDRAMERLMSATKASDISDKKKAQAWMYVGVIHFELGDSSKAKTAWKSCFSLDASAQAPEGISPKMLEAITIARVEAKSSPTPPVQQPTTDTKPSDGGVTKPKPADNKLPELKPTAPDDDGSGAVNVFGPDFDWVLWGSVAGGATLAIVATVVVIALNTSSNECQTEAGGCILVSYK